MRTLWIVLLLLLPLQPQEFPGGGEPYPPPGGGDTPYTPWPPGPYDCTGVPPCQVFRAPTPICAAQVTLDVETTNPILVQLYGGNNLVFPGEPDCLNVRHEVIVVTDGNDPDVDGLVKVAWDQTVEIGPDPGSIPLTWTLTTAEYNAMPPPSGAPAVDIWLRSYTCSDSISQDFCQVQVLPGP